MVVSMTGFGHSNISENEINVTTEIKTVNHRYCEINIRLPKEISILEEEIKQLATKRIRRGKADIVIQLETPSIHNEELIVKWELLDQYVKAITEMENRYHISNHLSIDDVLKLPNLFEIQYMETSINQLKQFVFQSVEAALTNLGMMRKTEGAALKADIAKRLVNIKEMVMEIMDMVPEQIASYRTRLTKLIHEINETMMDEQRMMTEVALFADRINVDEELTRLKSHVEQFLNILEENGTIGRKLDFLLQEMNREINTIGAKSNHIEISKKVVDVKSEIEKLREQVQNIE